LYFRHGAGGVPMNLYFEERLHLSSFDMDGKTFTFLLNSRRDHIQQFLDNGEFYEREELELLCRYCNGCTRLLDVGANIGNHSIFLAHRLGLQRVTPTEPQPAILHLLKANLGLNWHPSFDFSQLGIALSDRAGWARIGAFDEANIGGTRIVPAPEDSPDCDRSAYPVRLCAGDDLFRPGDFDIIKVDVEGMEIATLRGLRHCLQDFQGTIFAEVRDDNIAEFAHEIDNLGFRRVDEYRRYARCSNWVLRR
jgi:FkbM family methyltransferase